MATTTEEQMAPPAPGTTVPARIDPKPQATLARRDTMAAAFQGLMPTTVGEVMVLATHLAKSQAIPKSLRGSAETAFTVIWAGMELGLTPIRSLQSISNISGTLCMKADLQLALTQSRGVLPFYDENFERAGVTDLDLGERLKLSMRIGKVEDHEDQADLIHRKILAAVVDLKKGDPYGWAAAVRRSEAKVHVRTFTFADAQKAIIYEHDEANPGAPKERKPLSEKFNYKSFPGDMYPKRARTRLLQVVASDVTNGLPSVEAMEGGQVIDAEYRYEPDPPDDVEALLVKIEDGGPASQELAQGIRSGFDVLQIGPAKQLQLLMKHKGEPDKLYQWLRDEHAKRDGKDSAPPKKDVKAEAKPADKPPTDQRQPLDARAHAGDGDRAAREAGAAEDSEKATSDRRPPKQQNLKDLATQFKGRVTF